MHLYDPSLNLHNPESWLILIMYAGFWVYSYYSLVILLIHTRQENRLNSDIDRNSPESEGLIIDG